MFFNEEFKPLLRLVKTVAIDEEESYGAAFKLLSDNSILSAKSVVVDFEMGLKIASYNLGTDFDV
ncbi:hypothetical protein HZS_2975 [Henneguya salminicola]|nr:hypothetical protein HZS_2975 [Henneguya salminicola]